MQIGCSFTVYFATRRSNPDSNKLPRAPHIRRYGRALALFYVRICFQHPDAMLMLTAVVNSSSYSSSIRCVASLGCQAFFSVGHGAVHERIEGSQVVT